MIQATCRRCGAVVRIFPSRVKRFKYCSPKCRALSLNRPDKRPVTYSTCLECKSTFRLKPEFSTKQWKRQRFCSISCASNYNMRVSGGRNYQALVNWRSSQSDASLARIRTKVSMGLLRRNKSPMLETGCPSCGSTINYKKTPKEYFMGVDSTGLPTGNRGYFRQPPKFCSLFCATKFRNLTDNPMNNPESRAKHSRHLIEFYAKHPELHPNFLSGGKCRGKSSIEGKMCDVPESLGIRHAHQFRVGHFWIDFAIDEERLLIECDGDYWHQDKVREARRDLAILLQLPGWRILHFDERSIEWLHSRREEFASLDRVLLKGTEYIGN